jgi:hypothetical protein
VTIDFKVGMTIPKARSNLMVDAEYRRSTYRTAAFYLSTASIENRSVSASTSEMPATSKLNARVASGQINVGAEIQESQAVQHWLVSSEELKL